MPRHAFDRPRAGYALDLPALGSLLLAGAVTTIFATTFTASARADEAEKSPPISLTNADVARLTNPATPADPPTAGLIMISQPRNEMSARRSGSGAKGESPANSWQEEYYRLKVLALKRAIERGDPIHFGDAPSGGIDGGIGGGINGGEGEGPGTSASRRASGRAAIAPVASAGPACLYGAGGDLLYAPDGLNCRQHRSDPHAGATAGTTSNATSHDSCLYGTGGEVLHQPKGEDCDSHRGSPANSN